MTQLAPNRGQFAVLAFIVKYMAEHDERAPTRTEIARGLRLAPSTTSGRIAALARNDWIEIVAGRWRNAVPTEAGRGYVARHVDRLQTK